MTTSSANNSVFRGFFEKQKLTGPNFIDWYRQLRIVLSIEDKLNYLEQPLPPVPVALEGQQVAPEIIAAHTAWIKGSKEIAGLMLMTMEPEIQRNLENLHAYEMLQELKTLFAQQAEQELLQTTRDFHSCKQEEGQSVSSYVLKMKGYIDNLERLGHPVTLGLAVSLILIGLRKEFDGFVQNYNMHSLGKTVNELHAMLKLHEQTLTLPKNNAPALHAIRAGKVQKGKKHKKPQPQMAARGQNQGNGKNKHAYAPKPKIPPPPKREDPAKDSICHECGETGHWKRNYPQYLAELLKKKKNATFGAGGSGIFTIELNTFLNRSWIYDTGCGTHIWNTTQGITASRKLKPGALSLAFEKCVPCMSGKIARKPYTHQLEKEKDLLGLIHTDVCGAFKIMSRQGANYFVTFTDDFSRYGYVYLLKHKHKVFETFKVFQKEIENQLGKTIKSLCYDRGGEYMSQEFLDHLKDYGIIAHRTPPYTLQHNGVSERRNRTLLDMVRSMMSQTTLPKSFWDYALETAARILNMVPTKKLEKTPYEVWHGHAPKLFYLKVQGCVALVKRDTLTKPDKLEPRSTRTRRPTDHMCLYIDAEEHELGDLGEPANYKDLVELPPNGKTVGSKWLFKKKTNMDGAVHTYKARLVAKGYTQTLGIDYEEIFSLVADIRAIWILIVIAAFYDYEIWQMDVKTAFLNGYLSEEVHMEQPEGFVNPKYPNRVCKVNRFIYEIKQASRQWNKRFGDEIKKFGFTQNRDEPCVYLKASGSNVTFLILYVDDILIMGNSIPMLQDVKSYLGRCFAMKDLGEAAYILGIKIYRDRSRRLIGLCQSAYIEKILKRFHMENSKRGSIPMQEKLRLSKSQGASTPAELKRMQNVPYASAVGSIMYVVRCTRPDVAFAQNITSRFQQNPGDLKRELSVSCYTDAGYLTDAHDLKSQTGYVFVLNGGVVDWKSAKQSIFATSSAEAEYIAAYDASKEAVWVRKFIFGLGVVPTIEEPINMYCDNTGAIAIAKESGITKGARHFRAKVHYLREVIEFGDIKLEKVHTDDNLADPFTKALAFPKHSEHTRNIGMLPASSLM
ncbi:retrotransposon protein, putative, ty1-copia subclass [Tanacetum coccineum]